VDILRYNRKELLDKLQLHHLTLEKVITRINLGEDEYWSIVVDETGAQVAIIWSHHDGDIVLYESAAKTVASAVFRVAHLKLMREAQWRAVPAETRYGFFVSKESLE
jgi:hypothetical protein